MTDNDEYEGILISVADGQGNICRWADGIKAYLATVEMPTNIRWACGQRLTLSVVQPLKSLEEHNAEAHRRHRLATELHANGIACPKCGKELWDSQPMMLLTSYPPQRDIRCPVCNYRGYRLA